MSEPGTTSYQPFPAFGDWAGAAVEESSFDGYASVLEELRRRPDSELLTRAVAVATRAAAIDTGAIEGLYEVDRGFTMTIARGVAAWKRVLAAREPVVRRSFEDAMAAYDYVLDLATSRTDVSEKAIREIHQQICAGQETYRVVTSAGWQERPLPKGEYKDTPNNPTSRVTGEVHAYASPIDVPAEMNRLVRELRSAAFEAAHPVLQAAWAHYAFVAVHPFADGNGRVARALASVFLYRRPGVPLVIFADQKDAYLDGLEEADQGRPQRLVRFVQERVVDVIGLVQVSAEAGDTAVSAGLSSLRATLEGSNGIAHQELDAIASRLLATANDELATQIAALDLPDGVEVSELPAHHSVGVEGAYRMAPGSEVAVGVAINIGPPVGATISEAIGVRVRRAESEGPMFELVTIGGPQRLRVELREAFPSLSGVLELKIRIWTGARVSELIAAVDDHVRRTLSERGYL